MVPAVEPGIIDVLPAVLTPDVCEILYLGPLGVPVNVVSDGSIWIIELLAHNTVPIETVAAEKVIAQGLVWLAS